MPTGSPGDASFPRRAAQTRRVPARVYDGRSLCTTADPFRRRRAPLSEQRPYTSNRQKRELALLALLGCLLLGRHGLGPPFDLWCPGGTCSCPSITPHTTLSHFFLLEDREIRKDFERTQGSGATIRNSPGIPGSHRAALGCKMRSQTLTECAFPFDSPSSSITKSHPITLRGGRSLRAILTPVFGRTGGREDGECRAEITPARRRRDRDAGCGCEERRAVRKRRTRVPGPARAVASPRPPRSNDVRYRPGRGASYRFSGCRRSA